MKRPELLPLEVTAFHEAGHAVLAVATGCRFRYVSMRPRSSKAAAHVVPADSDRAWNEGRWEDEVTIDFAGIITTDLLYADDVDSAEHDRLRRDLTRYDGRTDLAEARKMTHWALAMHYAHPDWSATEIGEHCTPVDMAVGAWQRAVRLVVHHAGAIADVADALMLSRRALSWRDVRAIVDAAGQQEPEEEIPGEFLHPWFLDHTRLKWMPSARWFEQVREVAA